MLCGCGRGTERRGNRETGIGDPGKEGGLGGEDGKPCKHPRATEEPCWLCAKGRGVVRQARVAIAGGPRPGPIWPLHNLGRAATTRIAKQQPVQQMLELGTSPWAVVPLGGADRGGK